MRVESIYSNWTGIEVIFADERRENAKDIPTPDLDLCVFENIRLTGSHLNGGKISRTKFRNCYFRNTTFERVNLTGCEFVNCNLRKVKFNNCFLDYVRFKDCVLPYNILTKCNVEYSNNEKELIHELRVHAQSDGQFREARQLLLRELRCNRRHEWDKAFGSDKHDRDEFLGWDRVRGFLEWFRHWVEDLGWGYGLIPSRLLGSAAITLLLAATLISASGMWYRVPINYSGIQEIRSLHFGEALYLSVVTFSTLGYGDISPASPCSRCATTALCCLGAIFLGLIAAAMFKRMER